ncbi:TetR/AcrR family transcriptional regulator [Solibacillus daqui]|uniref:TetR/AcrR family transcriptional regulator n=1 Tax=Solibacillus daqui TaxID=2912187 RepID=UPI002365CDBD|nr:TetR/AcrR family transcriptional regulator [Solibacillus daqui]
MSKRALKKQQNRQQMIQAAIELFSKKPFSEVSVRDITKKANVSPALLYQYFDDQQHLFLIAMQHENSKLLQELSQYSTIDDVAKGYITYFFEHDTLFQMMSHFMLQPKGYETSQIFVEETSKLFQIFKKALSKVASKEQLQVETQLLFSTLNGLLITYKNLPQYSKEQSLALILSLVEHSLQKIPTK